MKMTKTGRVREYWRNLMKSVHCKLSEGAYEITKLMPHARNDNWRRNDKIQRGHEKNKSNH